MTLLGSSLSTSDVLRCLQPGWSERKHLSAYAHSGNYSNYNHPRIFDWPHPFSLMHAQIGILQQFQRGSSLHSSPVFCTARANHSVFLNSNLCLLSLARPRFILSFQYPFLPHKQIFWALCRRASRQKDNHRAYFAYSPFFHHSTGMPFVQCLKTSVSHILSVFLVVYREGKYCIVTQIWPEIEVRRLFSS